jgi:hypothetical protein
VTITSPPPPPPAARRYGEPICFRVDKRHATRLDNVGKAILDRFADALVAGPSATAVIVGYDDAAEHAPKRYPKARLVDRAAQCAVNTKAYLVDEKGIDPRRIELRTAAEETQQVILWLVPAGASMDTSSTVLVDESQVKPVRRNSVH